MNPHLDTGRRRDPHVSQRAEPLTNRVFRRQVHRRKLGRQQYQRATLIGLGLNKIRRSRTLQDTPAVRGMIERVKHLVVVE